MGLSYPEISPIMLQLGPVAIRWYSMAYLVGIVLGWLLLKRVVRKYKTGLSEAQLEDMVFYVTLGIILGGRLGYVVFYGSAMMRENWWEIFAIWHGGMSFHGGVLGVMVALYLLARKVKVPFLQLTDLAALVAPIGMGLGRIANFINDELWGRVTDVPWAIRFPNGGFLPRHPSQLYEAALEGVVLWVVLNLLWMKPKVREQYGVVSGAFVLMYAVFRSFLEMFREPDAHIGFLWGGATMGQILSLPLAVVGAWVIVASWRRGKMPVKPER